MAGIGGDEGLVVASAPALEDDKVELPLSALEVGGTFGALPDGNAAKDEEMV